VHWSSPALVRRWWLADLPEPHLSVNWQTPSPQVKMSVFLNLVVSGL
jgi:hypothetical protein